MMTKNRIRLLIAMGIILVVGFTYTQFHLRPVSERKKNNREKIDYKLELKKTNEKINSISKKIENNEGSDSKLLLNRARLYKSINKFDKAIVDYKKIIEKAGESNLAQQAKSELKVCENIKKHLDKVKN